MAEIALKSHVRKERGTYGVKRLRAQGKVPGIVYGKEIEPVSIELEGQDVYALTHGSHAASLESVIVSLEIEDGGKNEPRPTLITEIQHHPITGDILHIDFHQISLTEKIHARIPIVTLGESPGVSAGGILEHAMRELDISCRAMDLPEEAKLDISELGLGESIHVRDVDLGPNVEILNDPDLSVISVTVPRAELEVAVVEAEEEAEEPEVIGEREPEREGEEETAKGKKED